MIKEEKSHTAEVAFAVRDRMHNRGIGSELLAYLAFLAKREGLLGFTADVLMENQPMLHVFEKMFPDIQKRLDSGVYELVLRFRE
jgi:GNAT superfamily N-acetyltransferase